MNEFVGCLGDCPEDNHRQYPRIFRPDDDQNRQPQNSIRAGCQPFGNGRSDVFEHTERFDGAGL